MLMLAAEWLEQYVRAFNVFGYITLRAVLARMRAYPLRDAPGTTTDASGLPVKWGADPALVPADATFPAGAFGRAAPPERPAAVLVRNATIWTSAAAGILPAADLHAMAVYLQSRAQSSAQPTAKTQAARISLQVAYLQHDPALVLCSSDFSAFSSAWA